MNIRSEYRTIHQIGQRCQRRGDLMYCLVVRAHLNPPLKLRDIRMVQILRLGLQNEQRYVTLCYFMQSVVNSVSWGTSHPKSFNICHNIAYIIVILVITLSMKIIIIIIVFSLFQMHKSNDIDKRKCDKDDQG